MSKFGRYQAPEPPSALLRLHIHDGSTKLREVNHEPRVSVLDQEDLLEQGIRVSQFIPGAQDVDALGSCTANATTSALSNLLQPPKFLKVTGAQTYEDVAAAEKFAIRFYHACTDQSGDPGQEWPPTDCGSSGPYIVTELQRQGLAKTDRIAHGAENLVSLMQSDGVLMGSPWLNAWMTPDSDGFIDGNGTPSTLQSQINQGVAGGHETYLSAIEKLALLPSGQVDPANTILRGRNSWTANWGDRGSYRIHLSTIVTLGSYIDLRQLVAE